MHELNICYNIIHILEQEAQVQCYQRIKKLWLQVGELAGVELDALQFSFPIASANTLAANAALEIISVAGCAHCESCETDVTIMNYYSPCPQCGGYNYHIMRGKELKILKVEVE